MSNEEVEHRYDVFDDTAFREPNRVDELDQALSDVFGEDESVDGRETPEQRKRRLEGLREFSNRTLKGKDLGGLEDNPIDSAFDSLSDEDDEEPEQPPVRVVPTAYRKRGASK